jgi:hypothetical protein
MKRSVDIALGTAPEVYQLFSYANPALALTDVISHGFNQSLQRDLLFGSWADAYIHESGEYRVKLTSPNHDLSGYVDRVGDYLAAGRLALKTFNTKVTRANGLQFLLPFGLATTNVRSVQLFHFPPNETFCYADYLYSPTNRRWECLLAQNGFDSRDNTLVERIVDVVPIAAAGGAMNEIAPYNFDFLDYGQKQLCTFLAAGTPVTPPMVAYGGPVRDWLWKSYPDQIKAQLGGGGDNPLWVLSLVDLEIVTGTRTPVLCANHPSMYLYDTDVPVDKVSAARSSDTGQASEYLAPLTVMREDLIAAGWQAAMSSDWDADAAATLSRMQDRWAADDEVKDIMREQDTEFGYAS